jgi:hypothetical protein
VHRQCWVTAFGPATYAARIGKDHRSTGSGGLSSIGSERGQQGKQRPLAHGLYDPALALVAHDGFLAGSSIPRMRTA